MVETVVVDISFVKLLIIIVEQRAALSPRLGQFWTELGKSILCLLSFFLLLFFYFSLCLIVINFDIGCLINLIHPSSILLV